MINVINNKYTDGIVIVSDSVNMIVERGVLFDFKKEYASRH